METTSFCFPDTGLMQAVSPAERDMEDLSFQSPCKLLTGLGSVDIWSLHRAELVQLPCGPLLWPSSVAPFRGPLLWLPFVAPLHGPLLWLPFVAPSVVPFCGPLP